MIMLKLKDIPKDCQCELIVNGLHLFGLSVKNEVFIQIPGSVQDGSPATLRLFTKETEAKVEGILDLSRVPAAFLESSSANPEFKPSSDLSPDLTAGLFKDPFKDPVPPAFNPEDLFSQPTPGQNSESVN